MRKQSRTPRASAHQRDGRYAERPRTVIVVFQRARQEDDATENVAWLAEASFLAPPVARCIRPARPLPVEALDRGHLRVARGEVVSPDERMPIVKALRGPNPGRRRCGKSLDARTHHRDTPTGLQRCGRRIPPLARVASAAPNHRPTRGAGPRCCAREPGRYGRRPGAAPRPTRTRGSPAVCERDPGGSRAQASAMRTSYSHEDFSAAKAGRPCNVGVRRHRPRFS